MTHDTDRDQFYLKEFIAPIMPIAMALAAAYVIGLWGFDLLTDAPASLALILVGLGGGAALLVLAAACRHLARKGAFHSAALVAISFGGIFAVSLSIRAWVNEDGLLTVLPACMMLIALGSLFAQRLWHLLAAFATIMGPGIALAIMTDPAVSTEGRYYPHVAMLTLFTVLSFYSLTGLIKRRYYGVLVEQLERAARDPLTLLLNRTAWQERAERTLNDDRDLATPLTLLFLDVDHFKCVNDRIGHAMGDHVLMRVADLLRQVFGPDALIARYGGEEFVALLTDVDRDEARRRADRLRAALAGEPIPELTVTMSIGIAAHEPGESLSALLLRADRALLTAKARGRDRVELAPRGVEYRNAPQPADALIGRTAFVGPLAPASAVQASEA